MSLRTRLTLLYTLLVLGGLMTFGSLAYGLVSLALVDQTDRYLEQQTDQLLASIRINDRNEIDPASLNDQAISEQVIFQVWSSEGRLLYSHPSVFNEPLTGGDLVSSSAVDTYTSPAGRLRVWSVPVKTLRRDVGVLQVGRSMTFADTTLRNLVIIMLVLGLIIAPASGLAAWVMNREALKPLFEVTHLATSISKADDLHKRINITGKPSSETRQLMEAFNQTLERLENLFTTQNRFIADVSHELRTPLTVIKGNVGLMKRIGSGDPESLDSINMEVDRLTRLVGDLLLLAQAETGNLPMEMRVVEMDVLFMEVYQQMKVLAGQRVNLKITDLDAVRVKGDADRLKQVMLNLVSNAIQHTPDGGAVSICLGKHDGMGTLEVTDTGPGIPPEDLPFVFDRFFRTEKSRKRERGSGFGLGLSIVRWIVNGHEGRVEVESRVGEGTTFRVFLPLWDDPMQWSEAD
jgi:two-component system OmpR family sensor kinase